MCFFLIFRLFVLILGGSLSKNPKTNEINAEIRQIYTIFQHKRNQSVIPYRICNFALEGSKTSKMSILYYQIVLPNEIDHMKPPTKF